MSVKSPLRKAFPESVCLSLTDILAPTEPTECSVLSENLYVVGPRLYTTAGLSDRTLAWALHIIEYTAPAPLLQRGYSDFFLSSVESQTVNRIPAFFATQTQTVTN